MPPVAWRPVLLGAAIAVLGTMLGAPFPAVAIGALIAGSFAPMAPAYQGALVAVAAIVALGVLPGGPSELPIILLMDAALLAVGSLAALGAARLRPGSAAG